MKRPPSLVLPGILALFCFVLAACPAPSESSYPVRDCSSEIRFHPRESIAGDVQVQGEWNGFAAEPMERLDDGSFRKTLTLEPRQYGYQFVIAGKDQLDEANPYRRWVSNAEYSLLRVGDCRDPQLRFDSFQQPSHGTIELQAQYVDGSEKQGLATDSVAVTLDGEPVTDAFDPATGKFSLHREGIANGKHTLRLSAKDSAGRAAEELYLPFWVESEPFDWQEAILYFAFTDRFRNGNPANDAPTPGVDPKANYQGGDFEGIRQAIDEGYFDQLGVRAIWISPVQANPDDGYPGTLDKLYTGYHGYWPISGRETQRRFGSLEDLKALTRTAHQHGIRVITDLVINHLHEQHPYFAEHKNDGWFNIGNACVCGVSCDWEARRLDCWFTSYLPDLNWRSSTLADQMIDDALYWVKEADLDGFRLDAVKHVDHVAGRSIAGRLNEIGNRTGVDYYLVGETFTGTEGRELIAQYLGPNELDGQFDFPLYWPIVDAFARGQSLTLVDDAVKQNEAFYAPGVLNSPFAGNHDVPRLISIAAGQVDADTGKQAWESPPPATVTSEEAFRSSRDALTFVLTLPGVPLIYYGDEIGMPGTGDPDNRRMMKWGSALSANESALLDHLRKVGQARRHNRGLRFGARYTLWANDDTLVYQRDDAGSDDGALVTISRGAEPQTLTVPLRGRLKAAEGKKLKDVISGNSAVVSNGQITLSLPAQSAGVWIAP